MRSPARTEAAALAVRPIFNKPSTLELIGRYAIAQHALRTCSDAEFNRTNEEEFVTRAELLGHVKDRLNLSDEGLALLVECLA